MIVSLFGERYSHQLCYIPNNFYIVFLKLHECNLMVELDQAYILFHIIN